MFILLGTQRRKSRFKIDLAAGFVQSDSESEIPFYSASGEIGFITVAPAKTREQTGQRVMSVEIKTKREINLKNTILQRCTLQAWIVGCRAVIGQLQFLKFHIYCCCAMKIKGLFRSIQLHGCMVYCTTVM